MLCNRTLVYLGRNDIKNPEVPHHNKNIRLSKRNKISCELDSGVFKYLAIQIVPNDLYSLNLSRDS